MVKDSVIKMTKEQKFAMLVSRTAVALAKQAGDPLYDKYRSVDKKRKQLLAEILRKYRQKAIQIVRKTLMEK